MTIKNRMMIGVLGTAITVSAVLPMAGMAHEDGQRDFGAKVERMLADQSGRLFGFHRPLAAPADASHYVPREAAGADDRVLLAKGLKARFVTRNMAQWGDMMSFWPNENSYSHLIVCIEQGRAADGANPAVQRVNVNTGEVETILFGMDRCDGVATTPWGTVLVSEETDDGRAYEIIDPLTTTGQWVADRATGDVRDGIGSANASTRIAQRQAMPTAAWEGLDILPSGVTYSGDELRPGTAAADVDGGAIFKFLPDAPRTAAGPIADLGESPLVSGAVFALSTSCVDSGSSKFPQTGQGCEIGQGGWVAIDALNAREDANLKRATGFYRPEDLHIDTAYSGPGARFCWTNTGNEAAHNFSEVVCAVDATPVPADPTLIWNARNGADYLGDGAARTVVTANRLVEGDPRLNSADNLAFQPGTGNVYVIEDHRYGEVWACLPDGADRDIKSDGCVAMLSIIDPNAEPTGFLFDGSGKVAFVNVQHGEEPAALLDFASNPVNGYTDDMLMITGFGLDD